MIGGLLLGACSSTLEPQTVPLDSNLFLAFEETGGRITLKVWTEKFYGCCNFQVDAELSYPGRQQIEIAIRGVYRPKVCLTEMGPATWKVSLGRLDGAYELAFIYKGLRDRYRLTASSVSITLEPDEVQFTWPKYEMWLRLPPEAIWFVARARTVDPEGKTVYLDRSSYQAEVERFFAALEGLGAEPFVPPEGVYSNRWFVPPWSNWWQSDSGYIRIPINARSFHEFKWPDIRYYRYAGAPERLKELVQNHSSAAAWITGYTWEGERLKPKDQ